MYTAFVNISLDNFQCLLCIKKKMVQTNFVVILYVNILGQSVCTVRITYQEPSTRTQQCAAI
jgi:hypothetical protein